MMLPRIIAAMALSLAWTLPLSAQPSFDCAQAGSEAEELVCADAELAELDRQLADRFGAALAAAEALDAGADAAVKDLRATQRGWIKGRDDCWKAQDARTCVAEAYRSRAAELVALWMLDEPQAVASFACEGSPANEVTVFFFTGQTRAIRIEYGDSIRAGWLVRAASGSKYATPFGGMFWQKGDDALFVWTEGVEMSCKISG